MVRQRLFNIKEGKNGEIEEAEYIRQIENK